MRPIVHIRRPVVIAVLTVATVIVGQPCGAQTPYLVKDINPAGGSFLESLTDVSGALFFSAYDGTNGVELWKSDGTEAGTTIVADIFVGVLGSFPASVTEAGGTLFFSADDAMTGVELWALALPSADLAITKDDGVTEVSPGQLVTYTITASNPTGPLNTEDAIVEDVFPPALSDCSWACIGTAGGACTPGPVAGDIDDMVDLPVGAEVTYTATCTVLAGGESKRLNHTPDPSVVNIPGTFQDELGCLGDWMPDCATTYLGFDAEDGVWQGTFTLSAGGWEYKAALNDSWDENYGLNATPNGPSIPLSVGSSTAVKFYYDHETHWITDNVNSEIAVAIGDFQQVLGCLGNTDPGCLRSWLQDPDGDEVFELVTTAIPPGHYLVRVAIGESMSIIYGAGGVLGGPEIPFTVATQGQEVHFSFDWATKVLTIVIGDPVGTNLVNTATVTAVGVTDPDPTNNTATDDDLIMPIPEADVAITKTDGQTTAVPGEPITYTIVASNAGPGEIEGGSVTDAFPAELQGCTWTCIPGGDGNCTPSGAGDINDLIDLRVGDTVTYTVDCAVAPDASGSIANTATVTPPSGVTDPVPGNNSATDTDTIDPRADLNITKSNGRNEIVETHETTYAIVVTNPGPSDVVDAQVADAFPPELTDCDWTCDPSGGGSCTVSGIGDIDDLVDLPAGSWVTYSATCTVAASSGTCDNTATVTPPAGVTDPNPSDNTATDSDHVTALADFIFSDGFESGDTTPWSGTVPPIVLEKSRNKGSSDRHRVAFRLDLATVRPLGRFTASVAAGYDVEGAPLFVLSLRRDEDGFAVRARIWADEGSSVTTDWVALPHPLDDVELRWLRSLPGLADGRIELYVDGFAPVVLEKIDNDDRPLMETARGVTIEGKAVTKEMSPTE